MTRHLLSWRAFRGHWASRVFAKALDQRNRAPQCVRAGLDAHELLEEASRRVLAKQIHLRDVLAAMPEVRQHLSETASKVSAGSR
jgi:hypothetical protein